MEFQSRNYASKNLTAEILKFRGKAQIKFSRKFLICGKEEFAIVLQAAYLGLRPIKIKTPRQKRL